MEATVVSGDYDFRDIIIPKSFTYNGREFSVVTIGEYAFSRMGANNLISLSLPNSIKNIKDYAFGENGYLKKIVIPNSVEKISPWNSFIAKDSIIFEDGDTSIEFVWHKNSYRGFFSSRYIYFGRQIKSIQYGALTLEKSFWGLAGCNKIETIEYGSSVKKPFPLTYDIGSHNIYGMESLKTIILGENTDDIFSGLDVPSLERIICRSDKPRGFETSKGYFSDSQYLNIKLFIPKGTLEHYLKAEGWKNFFNIEEAETKSVTIQAKDYKRPYGEKNPVFQYSSSDLSLDGIPNISCSANENSNVGKYPIIVTQGTLKNVCVNYVNGTLTIEKAPLKITAKSYTLKQGDALPMFEAVYSGFKNNETASVLGVQPTIRTTATSASEPGTYDIIVSGAAASNYDITYVKGTLIILAADPVSVTAKSYSRQYGEANPNFEYTTAGATLSGTPTVSCSATAASPVGEYDIVASKGSVTNYNVTYVNGKLTITKAPLTITAKSYTIKQGDALPTFEAEYSGFKNNETASVLSTQPTVRTTATSASEPGTYDIIVSGAAASNYDITYVKGTLIILAADPVSVTAKSYSRQYGEANPNFEYTTAGATLSGTPTVSCSATAASPVGEYDIVASKGSVTNYNVTYVNGKLTVTKAPLTITAKSYTIKQGDALPTFEAEYSGFKNNETASVLGVQPTIRTTATSASEPGTYDIIVSGAAANNYDISYVKGTLTIIAIDVEPVTEKTNTFSKSINANTDLSNTVIDNTYYTLNSENGDGYDTAEQAIVLNSTITESQMKSIVNAEIGDADIRQNYNGIIFEVAAGSGTITIDAKTNGTHVLNVQIGKAKPSQITRSTRGTADVTYSVTMPTYIYLYASTASPNAVQTRAISANSVLLYSYKVTPGTTGIQNVSMENPVDVYDMRGILVRTKVTTLNGLAKGIYIVNGRKVIVE